MRNFTYERATTLSGAIARLAATGAMPLAGGTELSNWMKEGIAAPSRLVDIRALPGLDRIAADSHGIHIGALARMSDVAAHETVKRDYPAISQALMASASQQIRNMATIGGNLMQRNRCPYFRAEIDLPCNKRRPASGCSALHGADRFTTIFARSSHCLAPHASDLAVALAALEAVIHVEGSEGARVIPFSQFYSTPGEAPDRETALLGNEIITAIEVPASPLTRRSSYLKIRERTSYEFALVSVAIGLAAQDGRITGIAIALGGVAPRPWRLPLAEQALPGTRLTDEAALRQGLDRAFNDARAGRHNGFKIELAKAAALRAIKSAGGQS